LSDTTVKNDVAGAILGALAASGKDLERLTIEDLAPIDEFHVRGREATAELAAGLMLAPGMAVLDVGCGIGGASRYLAAAHGCRVTGVDLTAAYCRAAAVLTERVGLGDRVEFRQGDALAMPFADAAFDAASTQHAAMNIEDKAGLYREVRRVLKRVRASASMSC
jgi:ubiquinone/menaquinone biosynthesis C-methylase UbiE